MANTVKNITELSERLKTPGSALDFDFQVTMGANTSNFGMSIVPATDTKAVTDVFFFRYPEVYPLPSDVAQEIDAEITKTTNHKVEFHDVGKDKKSIDSKKLISENPTVSWNELIPKYTRADVSLALKKAVEALKVTPVKVGLFSHSKAATSAAPRPVMPPTKGGGGPQGGRT